MTGDTVSSINGQRSDMRSVIDLGLRRVRQALAVVGVKHDDVPIVHIAGTNGKGTVVRLLQAALAPHYRVGTFTSPHLISPIDAISLPQDFDKADAVARLRQDLSQTSLGFSLTTFEFWTVCSFATFALAEVDIAIVEVGVGGAQDATNVIEHPLLTVITAIDYDHEELLGGTIKEIATAKCGIIKSGRPVVIGPQRYTEALRVAAETARDKGSLLIGAESCQPTNSSTTSTGPQDCRALPPHKPPDLFPAFPFKLSLTGAPALTNAGTAISALAILASTFPALNPLPLTVASSFGQVRFPGRMQWENYKGLRCLVDGCHNAPGMEALGRYVAQVLKETKSARAIWVVSQAAHKEAQLTNLVQMCFRASKHSRVIAVEFSRPEDMAWVTPANSASLRDAFRGNGMDCEAMPNLQAALEHLIQEPRTDCQVPLVVVCGSLYLVSDMYRLLEARGRQYRTREGLPSNETGVAT